nr:hypothetical protein [uncultured Friedmanniella sp.]
MDALPTTLLHALLDHRPGTDSDAAPGLRRYREHRHSWYADVVGRLVLPDTALAASGRALAALAPDSLPWPVTVRVGGGAGGVAALAGRSVPGLQIVAVETTLRDLDDLSGNAARIAAAAGALDEVEVFVELPTAPGWVRAVEVVEAAGLLARVPSTGAADAEELAGRLAVLVEADLPFAVTLEPAGDRPGLTILALAMLVEALVDGAQPGEAAALLSEPNPHRVRAGLARWDEATTRRVRRRLRAVGTDVAAAVEDLATLGVLKPSDSRTSA